MSSGEAATTDETLEVDVSDLAPGQTRAVEGPRESILLCNVDGEIFAVSNRCTHAAVALTGAALIGGAIECPVHGARFDARTGGVLCRPARRGLRRYPLERQGDRIQIDLR